MAETNLFTMLSSYRTGSAATPFEVYCTQALAYFLKRGHSMLSALVAGAAGASAERIVVVEVQAQVADASIADLVVTFEGGRRAIVEVQVAAGEDESPLTALEAVSRRWPEPPAFVLVGLAPGPEAWAPLGWSQVAGALESRATQSQRPGSSRSLCFEMSSE